MDNKNIVIIGGGASGLMCAMVASRGGVKVTVLEADVKVGKKILISGNGRCNFTNSKIYNNSYNRNLEEYINQFNQIQTKEFFNMLGLVSYVDEEGRNYPKSNLSSALLDVINLELNKNNVEIITGTKVESVKEQNNGYIIKTSTKEYFANKVVFACGGGTQTKIFDELKIKYKKFVPSLCALKTSNNVAALSGIRIADVKVTLFVNDKKITECGEVLFKDGGISGICVMNLSAFMARANINQATVSVNLEPNKTLSELINLILERKTKLSHLKTKQFFLGWFQKNVGIEILTRAGVDLEVPVKNLSQTQIKKLAGNINDLNFNVVGFYNNNQVHSGGVCLEELTQNLQSKQNPGFYVCGEACDVDGLCGGYNLQWAWTSGYIVGNSLIND